MNITRVGLTGQEVVSYGEQMLAERDAIEEMGGVLTSELVDKWVTGIAKEANCARAAVQAVADKYLGTVPPAKKRGGRTAS